MPQDGILRFEHDDISFAKLVVVGIGGGGGNAVNRMIDAELSGVEYIVVNTDKQDLEFSTADTKIQIGERATGGLGAGGNPERGQASAEENIQEIEAALKGADMVFVTAGMGGGTGTGASPVVAKVAKDMGILTVGIVTKPFSFEGKKKKDNAELGIGYLKQYVDSLVLVPNDKLLTISDEDTSVEDALSLANDVLLQGVQSIINIITKEGLINIDFADVKTILGNRGIAHIGTGRGSGEDKVQNALKNAIESPLLETSINGAKGVLLNVCGGYKLGMRDVQTIADEISQSVDPNAIIINGIFVLEELGDDISVTVLATGFEDHDLSAQNEIRPIPVPEGIEGEDSSDDDESESSDAEKVEENKASLPWGGLSFIKEAEKPPVTVNNFGFISEDESDDEPEAKQEAFDELFPSGDEDEIDDDGPNNFSIPRFFGKK
jgi:cell division protein FtsZ